MTDNLQSDGNSGLLKDLRNSDAHLRELALEAIAERKRLGLDGQVGGLQAVVINTESGSQRETVKELLRYTGLEFQEAIQDSELTTCVLKNPDSSYFRSADFLVRSRRQGSNPFEKINLAPKSRHVPNTRLETFIFETSDLESYVAIQRAEGIKFLTEIIYEDSYCFIQTVPSVFTGNSLGFIEWTGERGRYERSGSSRLDWGFKKPDLDHLKNIKWLDHAATRVKAQDRNAAIVEFIQLTNYRFDFAIFVKSLNSITSVAKLSPKDFAMVFTSGISPYKSDIASGPTEKFIHNYGQRAHHVAFQTDSIEDTYDALANDGMQFLIELVGSPDEGLRQTFSQPSANTLLVNEYIHRYGGFDGFFTRSNVALLTSATDEQ